MITQIKIIIAKLIFIICVFTTYPTNAKQLGNIPISLSVTSLPKITVQKPGGGWYTAMELDNAEGSDIYLYKNSLPVEILLTNTHEFAVSIDGDFLLKKEDDPSLHFSDAEISLCYDSERCVSLSSAPRKFDVPDSYGNDFKRNFILKVSARQPVANHKDISGNYTGDLVLLFETSI